MDKQKQKYKKFRIKMTNLYFYLLMSKPEPMIASKKITTKITRNHPTNRLGEFSSTVE